MIHVHTYIHYGSVSPNRQHKLSSPAIGTRRWQRIFSLKGAGTHIYLHTRLYETLTLTYLCRGDDDAMMGDGFEEGGHDDEDDMYH